MDLLVSWQAVNKYIAKLEDYGIDPRSLPSDMNGRVCSYTCNAYEIAKCHTSAKSLPYYIERSATLVALCILGPANFSKYSNNKYEISMKNTVSEAAEAFKKMGPEATLDTKIIIAVGESGLMSLDFLEVYSLMTSPTCWSSGD